MEYLFITFMLLLIGTLVVFATKPENKFKILAVFLSLSICTALVPILPSINLGNSNEVPIAYFAFGQPLKFAIDPFSSFVILLLTALSTIYVINILKNKTYTSAFLKPEIILLTLALTVFGMCVNNGIYFGLACILLNGLLLWFINSPKTGEKANIKSAAIYLFNSAILLGVTLLCVFSNSFNFPDMNLKIFDINLNGAIFGLMFTGFALPAILTEFTINSITYSKDSGCADIYVMQTLFFIFYVYGLFRFISVGTVPVKWLFLVIFIALIAFTCLKMYEILRTNKLLEINSYMKTLQICLLMISIFWGILGQAYKLPIIAILSYMAAMIFFINIIFTGYVVQTEIKNAVETNPDLKLSSAQITSGLKNIVPVCFFNYSGLPATFGFYAWGALFAASCFGCTNSDALLKWISVFTLIFISLLFVLHILKTFIFIKQYLCPATDAIKAPISKVNILIVALIILSGLFPQPMLKIITVPTSFLVGGIQYYNIFMAIQAFIMRTSIFITGTLLLVAVYVVLKLAILKLSKHPTNK